MLERNIFLAFFFSYLSNIVLSDTRVTNPQQLEILPAGPQEVRKGNNLVLTCRALTSNLNLVSDLRWFNPKGEIIPQDERMYSEEQPGEAATALFIKHVKSSDAGVYTCRGMYASNQQLEATVDVNVYVGITWHDAPVNQYAKLGDNSKIKCEVRAEPPANIDWIKNSHIITSGSEYVIEGDGLVIQNVGRNQAGTYTCRARVPQTGELDERDILLEVHEPPVWIEPPKPVIGIESDPAELKCLASGSPEPQYSWVGPDGQDATSRDGWKLVENTGILRIDKVEGRDRGEYKCIAENMAGRIEASASLQVILRPRVEELYNVTYPVGEPLGQLRCVACGDPLPDIIWRKWSRSDPFRTGTQADDIRIDVTQRIIRAPDYTSQGEGEWVESTLSIENVFRTDDGLYECQAVNKGGTAYKSGHITVEFPPTFEDQEIVKEWSWDQRPVNLSCIATSIPNATISWWYNNHIQIGKEDKDVNFKILSTGPISVLQIHPYDKKYYRKYKCVAENILGTAEHHLELEEAREPGVIHEVELESKTATTLVFRFFPETYHEQLPLESYMVEYKESRRQWHQATRKDWPAGVVDKKYALENLNPDTVYDLRFSCRNRVGSSPWGALKQITTAKRGKPERPIINREIQNNAMVYNSSSPDGIINSPYENQFFLSWHIPEDNGLLIDHYLITYSMVRRSGEEWKIVGDHHEKQVRNKGTVSETLTSLMPHAFYMISVQAHNELGYSEKDSIIIKTKQGTGPTKPPPLDDPSLNGTTAASFSLDSIPLVPVVIVVVVVLVLILIMIDLSCWKLYYKGVLYTISQKISMCRKITSRGSRKKRTMPGQNIIKHNQGEETLKTAWSYNKSIENLHNQLLQGSSSTEGEKIHEYENLLQHNKASLQTKISNQYDTVAELPTHFKPFGEKEFAKRKFASEWALASEVKAVENVRRIPANNSNIPNLYDATPDHSILKNGLAKSLSQVCLEDISSQNRPDFYQINPNSNIFNRNQKFSTIQRNQMPQHRNNMSTFASPSKNARNETKSMYVTDVENPRKVSSVYMTDMEVAQSGIPGINSEWPPVPDKPADFPKKPPPMRPKPNISTQQEGINNIQGMNGRRDIDPTVVSPDWQFYKTDNGRIQKFKDFGDFQIYPEEENPSKS